MQIIDIPIQQGQWITQQNGQQVYRQQWLTHALKAVYPQSNGEIPTNVILKKTLPGLGATYGEIKAKRHSIIIEPNVPVILGKTKGKPKLLAVWEGCTKAKILAYLKDNTIQYKKLLTTPEGFKKIKDVCARKDVKIDIYNYFFCLFDECEKIVQDVDFRDKITQPINDFFKFANKAFVSATTIRMTHPEFTNQGFNVLRVKPQYNYKKDLDLIITDNYEIEILQKIRKLKDSDCVCVFLNKTDSIEKLIHTLNLKDEAKIFCSEKSVMKLKRLGYTDVFDQIDLPLKKYNFFTCRFFSAVDIEIREKPDIIMLTNLNDASYTMIDPFTEAIQIYGRFRDKYHKGQIPFNSLTHITNIKPSMTIKCGIEINTMVQAWKNVYDYTFSQWSSATDSTTRQTLENQLQKLDYTTLLDETGSFNYFSLDNLYDEERVKGYYVNALWLKLAYLGTGHFNINETIRHYSFSSSFQSANLTAMKKRELIVLNLEMLSQYKANNPTFDIESFRTIWRREIITSREIGDLIVDAYDYLGKTVIENIGYSKPKKLKEATDKKKAEEKEKQLFSVILAEVKLQYQIGQRVAKNDTKNFLKGVYQLNGIDISVTQKTIQEYCIVTSDNSANPTTYTITGYK